MMAVLLAAAVWAWPGTARAQAPQQKAHENVHSAAIFGNVHDEKGEAVEGAKVHLQLRGASHADDRTTDTQGAYLFGGLESGTYVLFAEKSGRQSSPMTVALAALGQQRADLELSTTGNATGATKAGGAGNAQTMEFSDTPQFTIAGVTDWTAAGGHGSDATLRASEAITRQALAYRPDAADTRGSAKIDGAEEARLRAAALKTPGSFEAQQRLGQFYLQHGQFARAADALEAAYHIEPADEKNEQELARACLGVGDFAKAKAHVDHLVSEGDRADAHRLAGETYEKQNDPVRAVEEFQQAVQLEPSEENYLAWGSELLVHRAIWQAKAVFEQAVGLYPHSARLLTALGAALFAGALYDDAEYKLCSASDLNPEDDESYELLGKIEVAAPNPLPCVKDRLDRYLKQKPDSAMAHYYKAMTVWKSGGGQAASPQTLAEVEILLNRAASLDDRCGECWLQLGNIEAERRSYEAASAEYRKAIVRNARLSEAHYRLGVAYDRLGRRDEARAEFALHDEIEKKAAAEVYSQRRQVKQFIVVLPNDSAHAQK